ncbi:MAG: hypothetical protein J0H10_15930 [Alphaproteobacteria bacterium]|nr:hypothetical protein [Alphaproteobacteria bacterium]
MTDSKPDFKAMSDLELAGIGLEKVGLFAAVALASACGKTTSVDIEYLAMSAEAMREALLRLLARAAQ